VSIADIQRTVRLYRSEFEGLIPPSLEQTVSALQRALLSADVSPEELEAVVLIGGSARIPLVTDLLTQHLGRPVAISAQPKHAVALGAALMGADLLLSERHDAGGPPTQNLATRARTTEPEERPVPITPVPAKRSPRPTGSRRTNRRAGLASGLFGATALLLAVLGPEASEHAFDLDRETGIATGAMPSSTITDDATMTLTVAGRELLGTEPASARDGEFNIGGSMAYAAGPLRATVTRPGDSDSEVLIVPTESSWWSRMLTIPGAAMVLLALFAFAYGESLLRPVARGRARAGLKTALGMAGVGAVTGLVLVLGVWIVGLKLMTPFTFAIVLLLTSASAGLLPWSVQRDRSVPRRR
ncbi:MAG: Hsp70 family protein, partial [Ornithinimicrobium sp.]